MCPTCLGKGARAALIALRQAGLVATLSGSGAVSEQSPEAGASVAPGAMVQLVLRRPLSTERQREAGAQ